MKSIIRIYVSCHRQFYVPPHEFLVPVQVGSAGAAESFPGMLRDDAGDNISAKNPSYCELTAQYWAWKNEAADFYGFFHYRRYLSFRRTAPGRGRPPYRVYRYPDGKTLSGLGFEPEHMRRVIEPCDIIVPLGEEMRVSVAEQYRRGRHQSAEDLRLAVGILREMHPEFSASAEEYLSGSVHYFGNLFVMRKPRFFSYCEWLFPILSEFDRRKDTSGYGGQAARVDGYLAERLLGIYYTQMKKDAECRCMELPRAHFEGVAGPGSAYLMKKAVNSILPPGSARRAFAKKMFRR